MKKGILLTVVTLMMLASFVLTGCATEKEAAQEPTEAAEEVAETVEEEALASDITIGFIPMTLNNEYFITMIKGAQKKADELGVTLEVQGAQDHASAEEQLKIVENMIISGVDVICIVPSSSEGLITALRKCEEAGIPVINLDTRFDATLLENSGLAAVPFIGTDNYAGAFSAGEYVVANIEQGTKTAILTGIEGQENAAHRRNGFFDAAGAHVEVVAEQTAKWEVDEGYIVTQNILNGNEDIGLIFASNDGMAIGALRAVEEADLKDQIQIIGFDAVSEALNLTKSGELLGTVAQYPAEMGVMGVEAAVKIVNGETIEMNVDTGANLITTDEVDAFLEYLASFG